MFAAWTDRQRQINKIWRSLSVEERSEYVRKARENRSASRVVRTQSGNDPTASPAMDQMSSDGSAPPSNLQSPMTPCNRSLPVPVQSNNQEVQHSIGHDPYAVSPATPMPVNVNQQAPEHDVVMSKQKQLRDLLQQQSHPQQQQQQQHHQMNPGQSSTVSLGNQTKQITMLVCQQPRHTSG
jgi:hypothetical protein